MKSPPTEMLGTGDSMEKIYLDSCLVSECAARYREFVRGAIPQGE